MTEQLTHSSNRQHLQIEFPLSKTIINDHSSSYSLLLSLIRSPSLSQQHTLRPMQSTPTRHITAAATIVMIQKVERACLKLEMRVKGIIPAQRLNTPLPKQLQKNRRFLTTTPTLHSMHIITSPESPMQAGITQINVVAFAASPQSKPWLQQQMANPTKAAPTIMFSAFKMQLSLDRYRFAFPFSYSLGLASYS